ncbi:Hypothetical protein GLP15_2022 [Giardia lamblia P15]|uniref:Uncharacterized protein n=1 Tax=Giardia intestinalis (strain P15) TaxID=658858 RepID=E1EZX6_GIAIA|nr:Hypothetical protein GLP15_2022 [Giardia lamblia P15]
MEKWNAKFWTVPFHLRMTFPLSDSDPDVPEETISFKTGVNLFEKHVQAISTGSPNSIMLALSTLHSADFSTERSRSLFYQVGGHQALISLLTLNRQADLGHAPLHITALILSECLGLIKKLVQYDDVSRVLFAGPVSQTPEQYNKAAYQRRTDPRSINYEDYNYVTLDAGVPIYLSILLNQQMDPDVRVRAIHILAELFLCALPRRVFHYLEGPASVVKRLSAAIPLLFTGNIFTNQLKPNKNVEPAIIQEVSATIYMICNLCSSAAARNQLRTNGLVSILCTLLDYTDVEVYEPCVLCLSKMVQYNNQIVLQELIHAANSISRICSMILPAASTQFLRAAALVLAKVANVPGGDVVVTTSGGIQPLINMLTVNDNNTLLAACQVIVGISSKPCVHDGDPDTAEASIFSMNHMIAKELISNKVLVHIQELLDSCGIEIEEPGPPPSNVAPGQCREVRRNPRTRLFKVKDNVSSDLFNQQGGQLDTPSSASKAGIDRAFTQGPSLLSTSTSGQRDNGATSLNDEMPLSTWSNLTSWLLHALANICPSEHIVPILKKSNQMLRTLLGLTGSCNPCVIRWACQCLANLAKHPEIAKILYEIGSLDVLFTVLKRCIENSALEEDYGKLAKAAIVASAAEALTGVLEDPKIAAIAGRSVTGIFGLVIQGLKTVANGTARAWLCGVIARLAKERENSIVLLEHRAVDYLSFLCLEASQLLDSYDFTFREQVCLAVANLCFSSPFYRQGRQGLQGDDTNIDSSSHLKRRSAKQQQMFNLFQQEYTKYGQCYGDGNVIVEFGRRGVVSAVCTFLTPVSLGEHVQKVSLQEFQCLRAAAYVAHALSTVGRNAILMYKERSIDKLLYLIAIGDKATQTSAANAIRCIRTEIFSMLSVLKKYKGSRVGVYTRNEHKAIIEAAGKEDDTQLEFMTGNESVDTSLGPGWNAVTLDDVTVASNQVRFASDKELTPKSIRTNVVTVSVPSPSAAKRNSSVTPARVYNLSGELVSSPPKRSRPGAEEEEDSNNFMEIYIGKIEQNGSKSVSRSEVVNDSFSQVFVNKAVSLNNSNLQNSTKMFKATSEASETSADSNDVGSPNAESDEVLAVLPSPNPPDSPPEPS